MVALILSAMLATELTILGPGALAPADPGVLEAVALTTVAAGVGGVEFVVDEGTGNELVQTDLTPPYRTQFAVAAGDHTLGAYLLDGSAVRYTAPEAAVSWPKIGVGGIHIGTVGDSITNGLKDAVPGDDISANSYTRGGGYAPVLNDYLGAGNGVPVGVLNDGNPGEESWEGALRMVSVLERTPEVQAYLVFYGANDSGGSLPLPSGLGLSPGQSGYAGSYKDYMQQIVGAVSDAGKMIFLAKPPPYLANATRNALVSEYAQVVTELVIANGFSYVPPDFFGYFTAHPEEFHPDGVHPNGTGYQSMARLWCEGLNGQRGWTCNPPAVAAPVISPAEEFRNVWTMRETSPSCPAVSSSLR